MGFSFRELEMQGVYLIENFYTGDGKRGFNKCFEKDIFAGAGIDFRHSETYFSFSQKNVIRGFHFQLDVPQARLVTVPTGKVIDVIVDLRKGSDTFGRWMTQELSGENHLSLLVPRGFGHGFATMENDTLMLYQVDGKYDPDSDTGIRFDDPDLAVEWPVPEEEAVYSERDRGLMTLKEYTARI